MALVILLGLLGTASEALPDASGSSDNMNSAACKMLFARLYTLSQARTAQDLQNQPVISLRRAVSCTRRIHRDEDQTRLAKSTKAIKNISACTEHMISITQSETLLQCYVRVGG